ncbi:hypothetical protein JCM11641_007915 [Rhodosporidiobolus odoratus]
MSTSDDDDFAPYDARDYWSSAPSSSRSHRARPTRGGLAVPVSRITARRGGRGVAVSTSRSPRSSTPRARTPGSDVSDLAGLSAEQAAAKVEEDAIPVANLSTSLKLVKAIQLLSNTVFSNGALGERSGEGSDTPLTAGLTAARYAQVVELLASSLGDVHRLTKAADRSPPTLRDQFDSFVAGIVGGPHADDVISSSSSSSSSDSSIDLDVHTAQVLASANERTLVKLFRDNARLTLAALQLKRHRHRPRTSTSSSADPSSPLVSPSSPALPPQTPSYIASLPIEILIHIFSFARNAAQAKKTDQGQQVATDASEGSRAAAVRFALALGRVCKRWLRPARTVAVHCIVLRRGPALVKFNRLVENPDHAPLASQINSLTTTIFPVGSENDSASSTATAVYGVGGGMTMGRRFTPRHHPLGEEVGEAGFKIPEEERKAGEQFEKLVGKTTGLREVRLTIMSGGTAFNGLFHPARSQSRTFLETPVFRALTSIPTVRHLSLNFCVDMEELESILHNLPLLTTLHISTLDALTGNTRLVSTTPHPASRLSKLRLGDSALVSSGNITALSSEQLCWILEPAINAGSLQEVDIAVLSDGGMMRGPPGGMGAARTAPFASGGFADLIARAGAGLRVLMLQDVGGSGGFDPSFTAAPHNGSFDYALSHLPSLNKLVLQGIYTGPAFLPSLTSMLHLRKLALSGVPSQTSAAAIADALEAGTWEELRLFRLGTGGPGGRWMVHGPPGAGGPGAGGGGQTVWSGMQRRRLEEIAKNRGFVCELA